MKRFVKSVSAIAFGFLVALLLAEIILKIAGFDYPDFFRTDVHTGVRLAENTEGWWWIENRSYVKINAQGMRDDREIATPKPRGVYRIAILGDSYAEAMQVPVEKAFWRILERMLNECKAAGGKTVEVLNFSVSDYSTAQELQTLRHQAWKFEPDMVLLAFFAGNDISGNVKELANPNPRPYFSLSNGELVLDNSFLESPIYRFRSSKLWLVFQKIRQHSRFVQLLVYVSREKVKEFLTRPPSAPQSTLPATDAAPPPGMPQAGRAAANTELGLNEDIYFSPPRSKHWENAWRVTDALLIKLHEEVTEKGASFVVATLSNGIQVHPDPRMRAEAMQRLGVADLFHPDRHIRALAERQGMRVITLAEQFQRYAEQNQVYLHGFPGVAYGEGHWNENGHRLAGELISRELCHGLN